MLAAALALLTLTACGDDTTSSPVGDRPSPEPTSAPPTSAPRTSRPPLPTRMPTPPSEALQKIRVVGEVISIGDCVVLRDDNDITWTIQHVLDAGPSRELSLGDRIQVTGAPNVATTGCGGPIVRATTITFVD